LQFGHLDVQAKVTATRRNQGLQFPGTASNIENPTRESADRGQVTAQAATDQMSACNIL
jgi:hypothetical protein